MSQVQCSIWCLRLSQVLKYLYFSQIFIGILYKYHFPVVPDDYNSSSGSTFREWPQQKQKRRSSAHRLFTGMDVLRVFGLSECSSKTRLNSQSLDDDGCPFRECSDLAVVYICKYAARCMKTENKSLVSRCLLYVSSVAFLTHYRWKGGLQFRKL